MPDGAALAGREGQQFQRVPVRIAELEGLDVSVTI
jgi:hypothetical protein